MTRTPHAQGPDIQLLFLIARYGVAELLRVMSGLMETRGDITSVIVRECGAIELWRDGPQETKR